MSIGRGRWFADAAPADESGVGRGVPSGFKRQNAPNESKDTGWEDKPVHDSSGWDEAPSAPTSGSNWDDNKSSSYRGNGGSDRGGRGYGDRNRGGPRGGYRNGGNGGDSGYRGRDGGAQDGDRGYRRGRGGGGRGGYGNRDGDDGDSNRGWNNGGGDDRRGRGGRGGYRNRNGDDGDSGNRSWNTREGDDDQNGSGQRGGGYGSRDGDGGGSDNFRNGSDWRGGRGGRGRGSGGRGGFNRSGGDEDGDDNPSGGGYHSQGGDGGDNDGDEKKKVPLYIPPAPPEDEETIFASIPSGINFSKYDDIPVKLTGINAPKPISSFEESTLRNLLKDNVRKAGYVVPTPVQKYSIPIIMGDRDLMSCAQTGSGKTAAFLLPMLHNLMEGNIESASFKPTQEPYVLIVSPTRELALQIFMEARKFAYGSVIKSAILYGGASTGHQLRLLEQGCHVLVATPGRLMDILRRGKISFSNIRYLVLDEADRMLEMGFLEEVKSIVNHETMQPKGTRRTLMFSATFPETVQELAKQFLDNYLFLAVGLIGGANTDVKQEVFEVAKFDKKNKLIEIIKDSNRVIVFLELKRAADFLASYICQSGLTATSIHGDRLQQQREEALLDFKSGRMQVLVATSVASRGLDIKDVQHVINYDMPQTIDEYVHRIGRTGRVGNLGRASSFFDPDSDSAIAQPLVKILADANQEVPDWLQSIAKNSTSYDGGYSRGGFGGRDIRSNKEIRGNFNEPEVDHFNQGSNNQDLNEGECWDA